MEQQLQEQANKIQRYETKLRDIISAYQKLQTENASLGKRLQLAEFDVSTLRHELEEKTHSLDAQCAISADLNERMANLILERDNYRKEEEQNSSLKQQISQVLKELEVEQNNSKTLKDALSEAQEQHEASTQHFETRISDIISTLKTYQEIHQNDTETINQLRSDRGIKESNAGSRSTASKVILADLISTLVDPKDSDAEAPKVEDLFDFMRQLWRAVMKIGALQQPAVEKQLFQYLDLKCLIPMESLDVCEKEKSDLQQELEILKLRLKSLQLGAGKLPPPPSSASSSLYFFNSRLCKHNNETSERRNLELQLQEAKDQIKILRKQNLTTLLELESVKKSIDLNHNECSLSDVTAVEEEAANRLAEATARQAGQLMRLESEARRYREQTLNLLAEKEEEISELRTALFLASHETTATSLSRLPTIADPFYVPSTRDSERQEPDSTEITLPALNEQSALRCGLVHCAERHGRLVVELKKLRNSKRELEQRVEALEAQVQEDRKAAREVTTAKESDLSSSTSSSHVSILEDVNLTYVKNIIFNFLSSFNTSSFSSRMAVVKALSMALQFSAEEENAIISGTIG
ncbi:GRIP and coiled-coil domain-containing protein [Echinococcus granulosus]|uniref:GRIP and coiled-coil domain-containing protein n=1 Tax=Echinococcus granulosus TaxID=6210 RepID=W6UTM1_ECHGR|nr:GRIP and coiled-coil domain-containing protein [Echinococcus granulosus]EUB64975.1 GRIP and coiled-coil domain-containing protein [Echinococcus granulosus]